MTDSGQSDSEAVRLLRRVLEGIFEDWRTVPEEQMTADEQEARALLLRLGQ